MVASIQWLFWSVRALVVLASALFAGGGFAAATDPGPGNHFDAYLYRESGAAADPVNLIFKGADANTVAAEVRRLLGWTIVAGGKMDFRDEGQQRPTAWQLGYPLNQGSRFHMRIEAASGAGEHAYVLAGVHRDDSVACGHVGRAFDLARATVASAFAAAGYPVATIQLGNIAPGPQCDGSRTAGDGSAAVIDLSGTLPQTPSPP